MKHTRFLWLCLAAAMLSGCKEKKTEKDTWTAPQYETKVHQMPDYHLTDSTQAGNHTYMYEITRMASDSLPKVKDDLDDFFADNTIRLTLRRDGATYFDKTFTKNVFASSIDKMFLQNSILDGIRFVRAEAGQGLTFSFAVSYPESDMSVPFLVTVDDSGAFSFVKDDNLDVEEEFGDDGDGV